MAQYKMFVAVFALCITALVQANEKKIPFHEACFKEAKSTTSVMECYEDESEGECPTDGICEESCENDSCEINCKQAEEKDFDQVYLNCLEEKGLLDRKTKYERHLEDKYNAIDQGYIDEQL